MLLRIVQTDRHRLVKLANWLTNRATFVIVEMNKVVLFRTLTIVVSTTTEIISAAYDATLKFVTSLSMEEKRKFFRRFDADRYVGWTKDKARQWIQMRGATGTTIVPCFWIRLAGTYTHIHTYIH
jgi:hypothetical protein